ncbi:MAG: immune inhibitor A [Chloroflexota bacterium]
MKQPTIRLTTPPRRSYPPIALLAGALATVGCLLSGIGGSLEPANPTSEPAEAAPSEAPTLPPATDSGETTPDQPNDMLAALAQAEPLPRDRYDLAVRFLGVDLDSVEPPEPISYEVGDVASFWVEDSDTEEVSQVEAELVYITPHLYVWVEQGVRVDRAALRAAADQFDQDIYPTDRSFFGSEALPGIDGDPRLHILNARSLGSSVAGYFFSPSEYPASIVPYSNEKEMFFISLAATQPGDGFYDNVLAHEFQHMIHWNVDRNEDSWLNEGLSELASFLNGFGPSSFTFYYLDDPDLQLNTWPEGGSGGAHYGAGFLYTAYFLDRFGQDALRALVANPHDGLASVDSTLDALDAGIDADGLFLDWAIANILNDPGVDQGQYAYGNIPGLATPRPAEEFFQMPVAAQQAQVYQYGVDYYLLYGPAAVTVRFEGAPEVRILPTDTHDTDGNPATDDSYVWWSNRGDESDMTLTHRFDLTGLDKASLVYDVWYWIEDLWDYGYVEVSTDEGQTWTILETPHTTSEDPHGNAYGPGYTGLSADRPGANAEGWLHEKIDLSPYAGGPILVRFETISDDAVNQPGMAIDNVCVPALDFCDDAEAGAGEWESQGFVRHNNVLPQNFGVQVILPNGVGNFEVLPFPLDAHNQGEFSFTIDQGEPAVLVVSGLTRYTTQPAEYSFEVMTE